jgi:hypothetical protein
MFLERAPFLAWAPKFLKTALIELCYNELSGTE